MSANEHASRHEHRRLSKLRAKSLTNKNRIITRQREDADYLFAQVAIEMGYQDTELVRAFYSAFVRVTIRELRSKLIVRWPGLMDVYLVFRASKKVRQFNGVFTDIGNHHQLRFSPHRALRDYFKSISDKIEPRLF